MRTKRGFTLTELAVAIAFVSILLLTIAAVTISMLKNYHKGLAMKSINTVGLDLIDEFSSAISESPVFDAESLCKSLGDIGVYDEVNDTWDLPGGVTDSKGANACIKDGARQFIYQQFVANIDIEKKGVIIKGPHASDPTKQNNYLPVSGVFCTGKYSYVWNTGYIVSQEGAKHTMTSYIYSGGSALILNGGFRLKKYSDPGRSFCRSNFPPVSDSDPTKHYPKYDGPTPGTYVLHYLGSSPSDYSALMTKEIKTNIETSMTSASKVLSEELISASDLAIYSLTIDPPTINKYSGRSLYTGSFVLGSISGDIDLNKNLAGEEGKYSKCSLEDASSFDVEFCATNKFNFAIRAMGGNSEK